ncbi:hypothetical protein [Streptomyces vinaceus]|uniref:hypothetical protein n=1 Tax=Streptomyces vinaceus TaxID=1960 RepID=UPI00368D976C
MGRAARDGQLTARQGLHRSGVGGEFFTSLACQGNAAFEQREVDGPGFWSGCR